jgi:hypothetical protein
VTRAGRLVGTLVAALALAAPATAAADAVTSAELTALGERAAAGAGSARELLLAVDEVDGRRVDVRAALGGARGKEITERVRLIAASVRSAQAGSPADERRRAAEILDDRRFKGSGIPRPFAKPLAWIGDRIEPIIAWINDLGVSFPGGPLALWLVLSALVLLAAGTITGTTIRRRALAIERQRAAAAPEAENPAALERAADQAERDGDWERAVRLRFRAGLLRLDRRRALTYRPSLTTGEVARAIRVPAFAEVGARFDEITYGGRPAERDDAEAARRGWKTVLEQATSR